jgi:energy-coupling factor transporter ATP-binding protein EcfA2
MKLTDLAIDGYGVCRDLRLGRFNDGLNLIYGETGAGKTTIRNFVRGVLFGFETAAAHAGSTPVSGGRLDVEHEHFDYRLVRDIRIAGSLTVQPLGSGAHQSIRGIGQLNGNLNLSLFDSVFCIGFHDVRANYRGLADLLHRHFGVPLGTRSVRDESAYLRWQQESELLSSKRAGIQRQIDALGLEKYGYRDQIEQAKSLRAQKLSSLDRQLADISAQIKSLETLSPQYRIADLKSDIHRLRELISLAEVPHVQTVREQRSVLSELDACALLYRRLDEIEDQVRRWRRVQAEIQAQRVRLRDEMLAWNEITLESEQHPYHQTHAILLSLESRVNEAEEHGKAFDPESGTDYESAVEQLAKLCNQMREDIYGLCDELGQQFKQIRQTTAAAELKQLRRCYTEMGDNNTSLLEHRQNVVNEIRRLDPAGADAVERAEPPFCQLAQQHGNLEARRRHVGEFAARTTSTSKTLRGDLTSERNRLNELELQLSNEQALLARQESQLVSLRLRHTELSTQRDQLLAQLDQRDLLAKIENLDVELHRLHDVYSELSRRLDALERVESAPHSLLQQAANYLVRMSRGELQQVWLDAHVGDIVTRDQFNNCIHFDLLSRGQQDLVYLSLCLAVRDTLARQGITSPMLLDDVFANLDPQRVDSVYEVLCDHCRGGNQVLAFAKSNELPRPAVTAQVTVFELPPTTVPTPFSNPDRQPHIPLREFSWASNLDTEIPFFKVPQEPTAYAVSSMADTYPISKYPRTGVRVDFSPATLEHRGLIEPVSPVESHYQPLKTFSEATRLSADGIVNPADLGHLDRLGFVTLGDLLEIDPYRLPVGFAEAGMSSADIDRWQAQYWLLICTPGMTIDDAKVLYACGITEPEQLDTTNGQQLLERINRYLATPDGSKYAYLRYSQEYLNRWYRALDSRRVEWSRESAARAGGYSRQLKYTHEPPILKTFTSTERTPAPRADYSSPISDPANRPIRKRSAMASRSARTPVPTTPLVKSFTERQRIARAEQAQSAAEPSDNEVPEQVDTERKLRFYLDLNDHVEAAPSIGNRTAQRFEKIGITTIRDFLKQTAESMAAKIGYKRITANDVRDWQKQARLICRIPNLRGHDAQLLVACGITEPEDLAVMQPQKLLDIIGPFSETKEGLKIIRSGKKPDLAEIKDWIAWAGQMRNLQAA